jgi:hypothetical protein
MVDCGALKRLITGYESINSYSFEDNRNCCGINSGGNCPSPADTKIPIIGSGIFAALLFSMYSPSDDMCVPVNSVFGAALVALAGAYLSSDKSVVKPVSITAAAILTAAGMVATCKTFPDDQFIPKAVLLVLGTIIATRQYKPREEYASLLPVYDDYPVAR